MIKFSIRNLAFKLRTVAQRFTFTLFFVLGLSFLFFLQINQHGLDIQQRVWAFFAVGISLSLAITIYAENSPKKVFQFAFNLTALILLLLFLFFKPEELQQVDIWQLIILSFVFILSAFVVSYLKENTDISFWEFSKTTIIQLIISVVFAQVLMLGLSLAVLSLKELFKVDIKTEFFQNLAVICYLIFTPIYFLSNVPEGEEKKIEIPDFNKLLKILGLYILLPILILYTLILYVYMFRIIAIWELPNGWVSTLVSVLAFGGFITMLIVYPLSITDENKVVKFLSKYFPLILLPLLILMTIGILRRLYDYGITYNRLYVFILNIWLYGISIYLFLTSSKHLKWIIISFVVIAFTSSVGPWSVFNVSKREIKKEISILLEKSNILEKGKVNINKVSNLKIDEKISDEIAEKVKYLVDNYGGESMQSYFTDNISDKKSREINKMLGVSKILKIENSFSAYIVDKEKIITDIKEYNYYINLSTIISSTGELVSTEKFNITIKNFDLIIENKKGIDSTLIISLKDKITRIIKNPSKNNSYDQSFMTWKGKNYKLLLFSINGFNYDSNDSITINNIDAQLFIK